MAAISSSRDQFVKEIAVELRNLLEQNDLLRGADILNYRDVLQKLQYDFPLLSDDDMLCLIEQLSTSIDQADKRSIAQKKHAGPALPLMPEFSLTDKFVAGVLCLIERHESASVPQAADDGEDHSTSYSRASQLGFLIFFRFLKYLLSFDKPNLERALEKYTAAESREDKSAQKAPFSEELLTAYTNQDCRDPESEPERLPADWEDEVYAEESDPDDFDYGADSPLSNGHPAEGLSNALSQQLSFYPSPSQEDVSLTLSEKLERWSVHLSYRLLRGIPEAGWLQLGVTAVISDLLQLCLERAIRSSSNCTTSQEEPTRLGSDAYLTIVKQLVFLMVDRSMHVPSTLPSHLPSILKLLSQSTTGSSEHRAIKAVCYVALADLVDSSLSVTNADFRNCIYMSMGNIYYVVARDFMAYIDTIVNIRSSTEAIDLAVKSAGKIASILQFYIRPSVYSLFSEANVRRLVDLGVFRSLIQVWPSCTAMLQRSEARKEDIRQCLRLLSLCLFGLVDNVVFLNRLPEVKSQILRLQRVYESEVLVVKVALYLPQLVTETHLPPTLYPSKVDDQEAWSDIEASLLALLQPKGPASALIGTLIEANFVLQSLFCLPPAFSTALHARLRPTLLQGSKYIRTKQLELRKEAASLSDLGENTISQKDVFGENENAAPHTSTIKRDEGNEAVLLALARTEKFLKALLSSGGVSKAD